MEILSGSDGEKNFNSSILVDVGGKPLWLGES